MSEKINFDVDWDALFPGKPFTVANKTHNVTPLKLEGIAKITKKIKVLLPMIKAEGIDWSNIGDPENIVKLIPILMDNTPDVVAEATGISIESLVKFPPQYLVELVTVAVQVNLESKESLEKKLRKFGQDVSDNDKQKSGSGELGLIIQDLVSNGHSWSNIKQYTLSEVGVFIRSIYTKKEMERIDAFSLSWMSSNLSHEGMEKVVETMKKSSLIKKKEEKTKEDVGKEWLRLAAFQQR